MQMTNEALEETIEAQSFLTNLDGHHPSQKIGTAGAVFLICATIMGAGIISIPAAFEKVGYLLGIILLVIFALMTVYTVELLVKTAEHMGALNYEELALMAFGRFGKFVAAVPMMGLIFGALVAFLAIIGDLLQPVLYDFYGSKSEVWSDRSLILLLLLTFVILPLSLLRDISRLESLGVFAVLIIFAFCVSIVVESITSDGLKNNGSSASPALMNTDLFKALPVIALAFTCQPNIFPIYHELKSPSVKSMRLVTIISSLFCCVVYGLTGVFASITYGSAVNGDVFLNLPTSTYYKVLKIFFCIALFIHYPIIHYAFRKSFEKVAFPRSPFSWVRHTIVTVITLYATLFVEIQLPSVMQIFQLTGAIGSFFICFIFPTYVYIQMLPGRLLSRDKLVALGVLILSFVVMVISIVVTTMDTIDYFRK